MYVINLAESLSNNERIHVYVCIHTYVCILSLLLSDSARLIVSVANGSPIEVTHTFRRVRFHLLAQSIYF